MRPAMCAYFFVYSLAITAAVQLQRQEALLYSAHVSPRTSLYQPFWFADLQLLYLYGMSQLEKGPATANVSDS